MQVWSRQGGREEHKPIDSAAKRGDTTHQRDRKRENSQETDARPDYQRRHRESERVEERPNDSQPNRLALENMDPDVPERPFEESVSDLETYTGEELRRMARQLRIHGRSKMTNNELIMAIRGVR